MGMVSIMSGAYQARELNAQAQRCVNLYPEINPKGSQAPQPVKHYCTPGKVVQTTANANAGRCAYTATNGDLYVVYGTSVFYVDSTWTLTLIGTIPYATTPVYMADNGFVICLVDGTAKGYAIDMTSRAFAPIVSDAFYGGVRVAYIDTYFVFDIPGTAGFYISVSNVTYGMLTATGAAIVSGAITTPGAAYTNGTYNNVPLTGGSGTGAQAQIVVSGNVVTAVGLTVLGDGYLLNDILSVNNANVGGTGAGFTYTITATDPPFDPLDTADKAGGADFIATLVVLHRELWLIGTLTTEPWSNTGSADFTFSPIAGAFIDHGTIAKYSVAAYDVNIYWLTQDISGANMVVRTVGYGAERISTHAIEQEFLKYPRTDDAVAYIYQQNGHVFYVLTFPTANRTWVFDAATGMWHERSYLDNDGNFNRDRVILGCFAYGHSIGLDYRDGRLYTLEPTVYTDDTGPVVRVRTLPHLRGGRGNRVTYRNFQADMEVGGLATAQPTNPPLISLRCSRDRGVSYGDALTQTMGAAGEYLTSINYNRLGMARDMVFELSWSEPIPTSLGGAWIDVIEHAT